MITGMMARRLAASATDPYWSDVVALIHCDGSNGSTSFIDQKGHAVAANGNAQVSTTDPKFGTGCALLDGSGDSLRLELSSDFDYTGVSMTYEFWCWFDSSAPSGPDYIMTHGTSSQILVSVDNTGLLRLWTNTTSTSAPPGTFPLDQWVFVQINIDRGAANRVEVYVNSILKLTKTIPSTFSATSGLTFGGPNSTVTSTTMKGRIDEIRVTRGIARPAVTPTSAFPNS